MAGEELQECQQVQPEEIKVQLLVEQ